MVYDLVKRNSLVSNLNERWWTNVVLDNGNGIGSVGVVMLLLFWIFWLCFSGFSGCRRPGRWCSSSLRGSLWPPSHLGGLPPLDLLPCRIFFHCRWTLNTALLVYVLLLLRFCLFAVDFYYWVSGLLYFYETSFDLVFTVMCMAWSLATLSWSELLELLLMRGTTAIERLI